MDWAVLQDRERQQTRERRERRSHPREVSFQAHAPNGQRVSCPIRQTCTLRAYQSLAAIST